MDTLLPDLATMYVLKEYRAYWHHPQVIRCGDREHTITLSCVVSVPKADAHITIFTYMGTIYAFVLKIRTACLYAISPDGGSKRIIQIWCCRTCVVICDNSHAKCDVICGKICCNVVFRGNIVCIENGESYFSLDMDTLQLNVSNIHWCWDVGTRLDGKITQTYRCKGNRKIPIISVTDAGDFHVMMSDSVIKYKLLFGEHDIVYLYNDGWIDTFQSLQLVDSRPSDINPYRVDNGPGGGIHVGINESNTEIIIWNPRDNTEYRLALENDNNDYYYTLISG